MQKVDTSLALMQSSYNKIEKLSSDDVRLKEQTDKFEAFFIKKVLDISMKNESKLFGKDAGDKIYNSMYNDAMSNSLSGGFGFSQLLFDFLKENR
jgi:Rod binding domain-containing protein